MKNHYVESLNAFQNVRLGRMSHNNWE